MLIRMESGASADAGLDAASRLEALIKKARSQTQTKGQGLESQDPGRPAAGPRVLLGPNGNGLAAGRRIDFEDPLARECFLGGLQQNVSSDSATGGLLGQHDLDPERVAALLDWK